jgi:[protein-PII] uridylyltransferase
VLDTFCVADARTGTVVRKEDRDKFEQLLIKVLSGHPVEYRALIARQKEIGSRYHSLEGERIATRIQYFNDLSEILTVIEIETEDRMGLLYAISNTLSELHINIALAKICTEKGAAIDSFYVSYANGQKILQPEAQAEIGIHLRLAIESLDLD